MKTENRIAEIALLYHPLSPSCKLLSQKFGNEKTNFKISHFCIDSFETIAICKRNGIRKLPCIVILRSGKGEKNVIKQGREVFWWFEKIVKANRSHDSRCRFENANNFESCQDVSRVDSVRRKKEMVFKPTNMKKEIATISSRAHETKSETTVQNARGTETTNGNHHEPYENKGVNVMTMAMKFIKQREQENEKIERFHKTFQTDKSPLESRNQNQVAQANDWSDKGNGSLTTEQSNTGNDMWRQLLPRDGSCGDVRVSKSIQKGIGTALLADLAKGLEEERERFNFSFV